MNDDLNWRYATKKFDPTKKVSAQDFEGLLEALRLAPSSFGLQPWKFVVVNNPTLRQDLRTHAWGQAQVTDASHLIILCSVKTIDAGYIKNFAHQIAKARDVAPESVAGYEQVMQGAMKLKSPEEVSNWTKRQVYLALGMLLSACAQKRIDACPMEGFDPQKVDDVLNLAQEGVESVVLCPIGYRADDDHYAQLNKARFKRREIFLELN